MTDAEVRDFVDKVTLGIQLAISKLVYKAKEEDGELVISKNGKPVRIKARDLK